jgi:hypothetical protein
MAVFVSWFLRYKISILMVILLAIGWITLWALDDSARELAQVRQRRQQNRASLALWQDYRSAVRERSPLVPLYKRYRRVPLWTRMKIREALIRLAEVHGLRVREYKFMEQSSGEGGAFGGENFLRLKVSIGGPTDTQIGEFIDDLNANLAPWVKARKIVLQRCGSVEDVPEEVVVENEEEGDSSDSLADVVEARIELDWLLTLGEIKNGKK